MRDGKEGRYDSFEDLTAFCINIPYVPYLVCLDITILEGAKADAANANDRVIMDRRGAMVPFGCSHNKVSTIT
jgi:hypothetical protein